MENKQVRGLKVLMHLGDECMDPGVSGQAEDGNDPEVNTCSTRAMQRETVAVDGLYWGALWKA